MITHLLESLLENSLLVHDRVVVVFIRKMRKFWSAHGTSSDNVMKKRSTECTVDKVSPVAVVLPGIPEEIFSTADW